MPRLFLSGPALGTGGMALALLIAPAAAAPAPAHDFKTYQPHVRATRISPAEAPSIDGDVSDAIWSKAQAIDEFYQLEPSEGQPPTEGTGC